MEKYQLKVGAQCTFLLSFELTSYVGNYYFYESCLVYCLKQILKKSTIVIIIN